MDGEGAQPAKRPVRPHGVEQLAVAIDLDAEPVAVVDLMAVEVVVLQ